MPSIANQDYKIYGLLANNRDEGIVGIVGKECGEFFAAKIRMANAGLMSRMIFADSFVFNNGGYLTRQIGEGLYYDYADAEYYFIEPTFRFNPEYYDAIWAIQRAIFDAGEGAASGLEFTISDGFLFEGGFLGGYITDELGHKLTATKNDEDVLMSLSVSDEIVSDGGQAVPIRFESLLPLVGKLPLDTNAIF